jgi:hypothetical protein
VVCALAWQVQNWELLRSSLHYQNSVSLVEWISFDDIAHIFRSSHDHRLWTSITIAHDTHHAQSPCDSVWLSDTPPSHCYKTLGTWLRRMLRVVNCWMWHRKKIFVWWYLLWFGGEGFIGKRKFHFGAANGSTVSRTILPTRFNRFVAIWLSPTFQQYPSQTGWLCHCKVQNVVYRYM